MSNKFELHSIINFRNKGFLRLTLVYLLHLALILFVVPFAPQLLTPLLIVFCVALIMMGQRSAIVVLFIVSVTTNGYILKEDYLLGALGPMQVFGFFAAFIISKIRVTNRPDKLGKIGIHILWVMVAYQVYTGFKNAFFGLHELSFGAAGLRALNVVIIYVPLIMLLRKSGNVKIRNWLATGLWLGCFNMVFFCFISPALPELGFYSQGVETAGIEGLDLSNRHNGVMGNGDSNSLGALFTIAIGFFLARRKDLAKSWLIKFLLVLMIAGVALSGSRTAFVSLSLVIVAYFMSKGQSKLKLQAIFFGFLFIMLTEPLWETVILRLSQAGGQLETDTSSNRVGKWLIYLRYMLNEPLTFLMGTSRTILLGYKSTFHQAHNVFITMAYNAGLFFVLALLLKLYELVKLALKSKTEYSIFLLFLPFLAIIMFVSDIGVFVYFCGFLGLYNTKNKANKSASLTPLVS